MPDSATPLADGGEVGGHDRPTADDGVAQSDRGSAVHRSLNKNVDNQPPAFTHGGRML